MPRTIWKLAAPRFDGATPVIGIDWRASRVIRLTLDGSG